MQGKPKILVIDDDEQIRIVLQQLLNRSNYEVDVAKDATEALVKLWTNHYDLALTDLMLPDLHGLKLVSMVQTMPIHAEFLVVTGNDSPENREEASRLGIAAYFVKPFDPDDLLRTIEQHSLKLRVQMAGGN